MNEANDKTNGDSKDKIFADEVNANEEEYSDESEDDFSDIPMNTNRPVEVEYESDTETSDEE